jgi:hypothetical protein
MVGDGVACTSGSFVYVSRLRCPHCSSSSTLPSSNCGDAGAHPPRRPSPLGRSGYEERLHFSTLDIRSASVEDGKAQPVRIPDMRYSRECCTQDQRPHPIGGKPLCMEVFDSPPGPTDWVSGTGSANPSEGGSTGSHRALLQSGPTDWVSGTGSQGPGPPDRGETPAPTGGPHRPPPRVVQTGSQGPVLQTGSQGPGGALLVITDILVKPVGKPAEDQSTLQHHLSVRPIRHVVKRAGRPQINGPRTIPS